MICYLIPTCITCIKQESLLKSQPNPLINVRYVSMENAKKSKYTFPLWQKGNKMYEGILVCKNGKMDGIFESKHSQKFPQNYSLTIYAVTFILRNIILW